MEEIKFKSLNELYTRLYPAFNTKKIELDKLGITIREIDIWNYLKENLWTGEEKLTLADMVSDIFSIDDTKLINFLNKTK